MKDIQNQRDNRCIDIRKVGVKSVSYPIVVLDKAKKCQHTVASINMYVHLPHHFKGTHMSRFLEILNECHGEIDLQNFKDILEKMKVRLQAQASHLEMFFPYFMQSATVQNQGFLSQKYDCGLYGSLHDTSDIHFSIEIPVYSAANNRKNVVKWGFVVLDLVFEKFYWIEDVISKVETRILETLVAGLDLEGFSSVSFLADTIGESLAEIDDVAKYVIKVNHFNAELIYSASIESNY
ncbi:MAG: GTP cyclohydrolase, FolE2/MptA family [Desulfotalea sp.]